MRKVIVSEMVTLDGFFAGPNGEIDWHIVGPEFNDYAEELLNRVDTLLFGRVTYQLMADYWPTPMALHDDPIIAAKMNSTPKVVFSRTLDKVEWQNSRLVKGNMAQEVSKLKQQPGKDMVIYGSGTLVSALTQVGLIDEYLIIVNPVVLGSGRTLFQGLKDRRSLKLVQTRAIGSGDVMLEYAPARGA
jgi:dihydrofolate reductase